MTVAHPTTDTWFPVFVDYHEMVLVPDEVDPYDRDPIYVKNALGEYEDTNIRFLKVHRSGVLQIYTGRACGFVWVAVRYGLGPFPGVEFQGVAEVSIYAETTLRFNDQQVPPADLVISQPGWHRVRVSAKDRDFNSPRGEDIEDADEWYLIEMWPGEQAPPGVIRSDGAV